MKQKMRMVENSNYENQATLNKIYEVELVDGIFANSPYYKFIDDTGKVAHCHTYRFEPLKENENNAKVLK